MVRMGFEFVANSVLGVEWRGNERVLKLWDDLVFGG